jgi:hypothetical protein
MVSWPTVGWIAARPAPFALGIIDLGGLLMKNIMTTVFCIVAALIIFAPSQAYAVVTDSFSDNNDTANPAWTHLSGYVNSTGQTWDASTGQYRMTAPNNGAAGFGFVGSYTGAVQTNVTTTADLVNFVGPPAGGVFGVGARLNGFNALGIGTGYAYVYEPFSSGGTGEFVLARINNGVDVNDLGADGVEGVDYVRKVTLSPNKDYRFSLSVIGTQLRGEVREILGGNPMNDPIIAYQSRSNIDTIAGMYYPSGFSGLLAYSQNPLPPTDVTWDNFGVVPEPGTILLIALGVCIMPLIGRRR